jgi:L-cysteine desulfidase
MCEGDNNVQTKTETNKTTAETNSEILDAAFEKVEEAIIVEMVESINIDFIKFILDTSRTNKDAVRTLRHAIEYPFDREQYSKMFGS